jgi:hypothetical protein
MEAFSSGNQSATIIVRFATKEFSASPEQVVRYAAGVGYKMDLMTSKAVSAAIHRAKDLIAPAVAYAVHPVRSLSEKGEMMLQNGFSLPVPPSEQDPQSRFMFAAVCTLGPALETACRKLNEQRAFFSSLLLDATGVALLETLGQRVYALSCKLAYREHVSCGRQFAPGYGKMPLSCQDMLFQLVDGNAVGVRLNQSLIMRPSKSISFFTRWTSQSALRTDGYKCSACDLSTCRFRKDTLGLQR